MLSQWLWVALGGAAGAVMRFHIGIWMSKKFKNGLPYGTLSVNLSGALLLGCIIGSEHTGMLPLLSSGFCGAYTTFSTLSYESLQLLQSGRRLDWLRYQMLTYGLGLPLTYAGLILTQSIMS